MLHLGRKAHRIICSHPTLTSKPFHVNTLVNHRNWNFHSRIQIRHPIAIQKTTGPNRSHLFWDKTAPCLGKWLSAETCSRCWSHYHHIFQDHLKLDIFMIEWCWYLMAELAMLLHLLWLRYTKRLEGALPVWDGCLVRWYLMRKRQR